MITTTVHSVRVSLLSHHRVVLLKEVDVERYLPIFIGQFEADAIVMSLQHIEPPRPMTHDLLKNSILALGATISHILISQLKDNTFYGRIVLDVGGRHMELDSRPSDAMALAVRCGVPIYVAEEVMAQASIVPSPELEHVSAEEEERLSAFRDFVNTLDLEEPPSGES
ncbi:MAG: bifunctional nuclease family protein [Chloroflexi bacterium]|nr:bifunctional nuclease family protein [Chloroflexota bacterium]